jgi:uncharacterized membrane protein
MGTKSFISGMTVGAGMVYLLDPERGQLRRERLRETVEIFLDEVRFEAGHTPELLPVRTMRYGSRLGDIEGLEGATLGTSEELGEGGTPTRKAARIAGAVLALYGLVRRDRLGSLFRVVGTGLLLGGVGQGALGAIRSPRADRRRAVDIQKTLYIEAPVEQVYAFWSNYENFPLFMSHVREVEDLGAGRSHWRVSGPGGVPIEWDATLTEQIPGSVIAWRSEPGSMLENAGVIRFTSSGSGTLVSLRFCYHPPAGGAGQAVAELLGTDPRGKLNEDLGRMKSLLEATTRSGTHGKKSKS